MLDQFGLYVHLELLAIQRCQQLLLRRSDRKSRLRRASQAFEDRSADGDGEVEEVRTRFDEVDVFDCRARGADFGGEVGEDFDAVDGLSEGARRGARRTH